MSKQTKRIAVTDTNIFIDLFKLGIEEVFFNLPLEIWTSDLIIDEHHEREQELLTKYEQQGKLFIDIYDTIEPLEYPSPLTDEDVALVSLAYEKKAVLVSGDKKMVQWCRKHKLESHGLLWVIDMMVIEGLIGKDIAIQLIQRLLVINEWFPIRQSKDLIERYSR